MSNCNQGFEEESDGKLVSDAPARDRVLQWIKSNRPAIEAHNDLLERHGTAAERAKGLR